MLIFTFPFFFPSFILIPRHTIVVGVMVSRWLSVCLSVNPGVCLSVHPSVRPSVIRSSVF